MKAARISRNKIAEVFDVDKATLATQERFHPDFVASLTDLPDNAVAGKYWINDEVKDRLPVTANEVTNERDNRMGQFIFNGKEFDLSGQSLNNVMGAGTLALGAIVSGAQPGNYRWADANVDFTWIANDNTNILMDAQTTWAFAQAAAAWRKQMIYAARALKDMGTIPEDFSSNNSYWGV